MAPTVAPLKSSRVDTTRKSNRADGWQCRQCKHHNDTRYKRCDVCDARSPANAFAFAELTQKDAICALEESTATPTARVKSFEPSAESLSQGTVDTCEPTGPQHTQPVRQQRTSPVFGTGVSEAGVPQAGGHCLSTGAAAGKGADAPLAEALLGACVGAALGGATPAAAALLPPSGPSIAAAAAGPNGGAEAAQGGKRKGAPQSGGKPKASMAPAKKAKTVAVSVADLDSRPHLELGVSSVEYAKVEEVGLLLQARANLCVK